MNFAHHVPVDQQFTHHTLVNIIVALSVAMFFTGVILTMHQANRANESNRENIKED